MWFFAFRHESSAVVILTCGRTFPQRRAQARRGHFPSPGRMASFAASSAAADRAQGDQLSAHREVKLSLDTRLQFRHDSAQPLPHQASSTFAQARRPTRTGRQLVVNDFPNDIVARQRILDHCIETSENRTVKHPRQRPRPGSIMLAGRKRTPQNPW